MYLCVGTSAFLFRICGSTQVRLTSTAQVLCCDINMGAKHACLLVIAATACIGIVNAVNPCAPSINLFPTGSEIGAGAQQYLLDETLNKYVKVNCTGSTVCNFPAVFSKTVQTAVADQLGVNPVASKGVLRVALKEYGEGVTPHIYAVAESVLMQQDGDASECVDALATRKLLAQHNVTTPGRTVLEYRLDGASDFSSLTIVGNAGLFEVPADVNDGCATIRATLKGYVVSNSNSSFNGPLVSTRKVCWYRNNGQAAANVTVQSVCVDDTNTGLYATVSNFAPLAQNLTQNGDSLLDKDGAPVLLLQDVIQVWKVNFTALRPDDTESTMDLNEAATNYFFVPANANAGDRFNFSVSRNEDAELQEGYYQLRAKASVFTKYPAIVDLQGKTTIEQTDVAKVQGYTEYMGKTIDLGGADSIWVGVQRKSTEPQLYDIDAVAGTAIKAGDEIKLTWQFYGLAEDVACFHDDVPEDSCRSPMIITARDFFENVTEHTFTVVMTDVCGNQKNASYTYSAAGIKEMSKVDYTPASLDPAFTPTTTNVTTKKTSDASTPSRVLAIIATTFTVVGMALMA